MICYNRDDHGKCLAFNGVECSEECSGRITDIDVKIRMIESMLEKAGAKKLTRELKTELQMALWTKKLLREKKFIGWMACYVEDLHRGSGGGQSESDSNRKTGLKQLMKDNRPVGIKPTQAQLEEYKEALAEFEEAVGEKMEKLGRSQLSHSRIDSYLGTPICLEDDGYGRCLGQTTQKGEIRAFCKGCPWLK